MILLKKMLSTLEINMKKIIFISICLLILNNVICDEKKIPSNIKPYKPEELNYRIEIKDPFTMTAYNIYTHNYEDALYYFQKGYENKMDKVKFLTFYLPLVSSIVDILFKMKRYSKAIDELKKWNNYYTEFNIYDEYLPQKIGLAFCYYKTGKYEETDRLLEEIDIFHRFPLKRTDYSENEFYAIKWLSELVSEYNNNVPLALKLVEENNQGFDYSIPRDFVKSIIIAKEDKHLAIEILESGLDQFYEDEFEIIWHNFVKRIERIRMFLAFLYYKIDNKEKALENFELALIKEKGSTFMGNWDYWFNYRDYFQDEHEVLLELKEIYLEQQNNK